MAGSYHQVEKTRLGLEWLMIAPIKGFSDGAAIIAFLLLIGGAFQVIQETGIVEFAIRRTTAALASKPFLEILVIPAMTTLFLLGGAVFGMSEETIPFILIFVPLAISLGYDSIVGVSIPFLGAAAGFAAAFFNPFTVGIAQGLAEVPLYSGLGYRVFTFVVGTAVMIAWVMVYAAKVKKNPQSSLVHKIDRERDLSAFQQGAVAEPFTGSPRHRAAAFPRQQRPPGLGHPREGLVHRRDRRPFPGDGHFDGPLRRPRQRQDRQGFRGRRQGHGGRRPDHRLLAGPTDRITREGQVLDALLRYSSRSISGLPSVVAAQLMFLLAVRDQLLHPFRRRPGGALHAGLGAARRPRRHHPTRPRSTPSSSASS